MNRSHASLLIVLALGASALSAGCSKAKATRATRRSVEKPAETNPVAVAEPAKQHGVRKTKNVDVPVWVDGKQMAVLRYGELPSQVKAHTLPQSPRAGARFYRIDEYLKAIGVPVERIRSIHMSGNRDKIASIEGTELRARREHFIFDFMQETGGIAKSRWELEGLKNGYRIDEIRTIAVYVDKPTPAIDPTHHCHLRPGVSVDDPEKTSEDLCASEDPYATGENAKGTRVYNDGKLAGYVKRRQLSDSLHVGKDAAGEHVFSLTKFMASLGVDATAARAIELVTDDDVIVRVSGADWTKNQNALTFTLPKHQHGRVRVHVPASMQVPNEGEPVTDRDTTVTAVLVHKHTPPSTHEQVPIFDEPLDEGALAAREPGQNEAFDRGEREN